MAKILLINGPNLNLLGTREPHIYGKQSLADIERALCQQARQHNAELLCFQSNAEHALIERIHQAKTERVKAIIINPAAYTHTSIALRDAFIGVGIAFYEVHLSNIFAREAFRHHSYLSDIAHGVICGLGTQGYQFALTAALNKIHAQGLHH